MCVSFRTEGKEDQRRVSPPLSLVTNAIDLVIYSRRTARRTINRLRSELDSGPPRGSHPTSLVNRPIRSVDPTNPLAMETWHESIHPASFSLPMANASFPGSHRQPTPISPRLLHDNPVNAETLSDQRQTQIPQTSPTDRSSVIHWTPRGNASLDVSEYLDPREPGRGDAASIEMRPGEPIEQAPEDHLGRRDISAEMPHQDPSKSMWWPFLIAHGFAQSWKLVFLDCLSVVEAGYLVSLFHKHLNPMIALLDPERTSRLGPRMSLVLVLMMNWLSSSHIRLPSCYITRPTQCSSLCFRQVLPS